MLFPTFLKVILDTIFSFFKAVFKFKLGHLLIDHASMKPKFPLSAAKIKSLIKIQNLSKIVSQNEFGQDIPTEL